MKHFETPSFAECRDIVHRLHGKTIEEVIAMLGQPTKKRGYRVEERLTNGKPRPLEIRRSVVFYGVGKTINQLEITERADAQFEYRMQGREIEDTSVA